MCVCVCVSVSVSVSVCACAYSTYTCEECLGFFHSTQNLLLAIQLERAVVELVYKFDEKSTASV